MDWRSDMARGQVRLRRPAREDATSLYERLTSRAEAATYVTWRPHAAIDSTYDLLDGLIAEWRDERASRSWVIEHPQHPGAAGGLITARAGAHGVELGYALAPECWGMGLMTTAVETVSDWALEQPHCFRVWATCDVDHVASQRVLDKAGFVREGTLRRWALHPNLEATPRDCTMHGRI